LTWRAFTNVFRKARNRYAPLRLILNPIDASQYGRTSGRSANLWCKAGNGVQTNGWGTLTFMGEGYLDAIREAGERDLQARMIFREMLERFLACDDDARLQLRDRFVFQTSGIREITCGASYGGGQPQVGINLQTNAF